LATPETSRLIAEDLKQRLTLRDPGFFGCQRKNVWDREQGPRTRGYTGTALLEVLGQRQYINTPAGPLDYYTYADHWIIMFRGGVWSEKWIRDAQDLWALVAKCRHPLSPDVLIINEKLGEIQVYRIPIDASTLERRAEALVSGLLAEPPARISKAGKEPFSKCATCAHRTRCNAYDIKNNETHDWSSSYKQDLG
jgi:hypothetical protein